jgi:hypothetical protein
MSTDPARRHLKPVEEAPPLIVVNSETGERVGTLAEVTQETEDALVKAERRIRYLDGRITGLERDEETEARKHELWAEGEALHEWWRLATGHPGRQFGADEFYQVLPRLKDRECGPIGVLHAIAGAAFDPGTKRMKNGRTERYDDWELVTRSPAKLDSFRNRAPVGADEHQWKRWLVSHIEAQLEERERDKKATATHAARPAEG